MSIFNVNNLFQTLTSWTTNLDIYIAANANADSANQFSGGTFTNQKSGYYHICSFTRFRQGGNANDNTVLVVSEKISIVLAPTNYISREVQLWLPMEVELLKTG